MRLRSNLLLLVAGTVLPLLALSLALGYMLVEHEKETTRSGATARTRAVMVAVDSELSGHLLSLQGLASSRNLERGNLRAFEEEVRRFLPSQPDWRLVILMTPSGEQLLNTGHGFKPGTMSSDPAMIRRVVEKRSPEIGDMLLGRLTKTYGVPIRAPVMRGGEVAYVLTADVEPAAFARLIAAQELPSSWVSGLVDRKGVLVARVPARESGAKASEHFRTAVAQSTSMEGWYRGQTVEGVDTFTAYRISPLSGWSIGMGIPTAEVYAVAYRAGWSLLFGTLVSLGLAAGFAWWMGRRIARPIAALAGAARQLGAGASPPHGAGESAIGEVRALALALQDASRAVGEREAAHRREQEARNEAELANRAKDEFLAMLGHELRNPLAPIRTALQLMRLRGDEALMKERLIIERQVEHLVRLVDDLLDVSRVTSGKIELKRSRVELADVVAKAIEMASPMIEGRQHRLDVSVARTGLAVDGDAPRLAQAVCNLLVNAAKYTEPKGEIRVEAQRAGAEAVLRVRDSGVGIAPDLLVRIFEPFVQAPQALERAHGGLGLGLAIVRSITTLHGGSVLAASDGPGRGAEFTLRLPLAAAAAAPAERAAPEPSRARVPAPDATRVLVVDDNADAADTIATALRLQGMAVEMAHDGPQALDAASAFRPDVALLDIGLPVMDGYELARRLREALGGRVLLVALTGYGERADRERSRQAGFSHHLVKPVDLDALLALVESASSRSRAAGAGR